MPCILSFDMGIKNLAFCQVDISGTSTEILLWNNWDLLASSDTQTASRCVCGGPPSWIEEDKILCKKGVNSRKTGLKGLPKNVLLNVGSLKTIAATENWVIAKKPKKEDYIAELKKRYLLPYTKPKGALKTDMTILLDSIERFLDIHLKDFSKSTVIRIENQPVFKAPTMKSVQMMLFSLLLHRLRKEHKWSGSVVFVHASKKTEEAQDDVDAAGGNYKARKSVAEDLTLKRLPEGKWRTFFMTQTKKADLADAFLMSIQ